MGRLPTLAHGPHREVAGEHAPWLDLNGDRQPDLMISHRDRLTWYPSQGRAGFAPAVEIPRPRSAAILETEQVAEDAALDFLFADMNGDGLPDLVQIRSGRVEYWPQIGQGRLATPC